MEIVSDLSNEDYHNLPAIGSSGLKELAVSPAHYWAKYRDPNRPERTETPSMVLGTAIHCAILEPDTFPHRYAVVPDGVDRRSNAGKALFKEIEEAGKVPLKTEQHDMIKQMAGRALSHPISRFVFSLPYQVESSMFSVDPMTGVQCKIRTDYHVAPCAQFPNGLIIDLKSTADASPYGFGRQCWNLDYLIQAALYSKVYREANKTAGYPAYYWMAMESEYPFMTAFYSLTDTHRRHGLVTVGRLLNLFAECERTNNWPGYSDKAVPLTLPDFAQRIIDNQLEKQS